MLVSMARRTRLRVVEAVNGREALSKMAGAPPDLILTDLDMPVMDGFELISRVRSDPGLRETPVVVLTTRGSDEDKRRAMAVGADAFLVKSEFNEEALSAAIGRFLEARR
jgi:CheY-like chemotaxis protein